MRKNEKKNCEKTTTNNINITITAEEFLQQKMKKKKMSC